MIHLYLLRNEEGIDQVYKNTLLEGDDGSFLFQLTIVSYKWTRTNEASLNKTSKTIISISCVGGDVYLNRGCNLSLSRILYFLYPPTTRIGNVIFKF